MTFTSYEFLVLLGTVLGLYYFLPHRAQNLLLLVASYVFYGWWDWRFLGLILASSLVDFVVAKMLDPTRPGRNDAQRKRVLLISLVMNLGFLGFFKYFNFFIDSALEAGAMLGWSLPISTLHIVLPVGISFYTFQTLSYTIDVYRGDLRATDNLLDFLLFVSFFPQLVAGPIERATNLLPQVLAPRRFDFERIASGFQLALVGFFKKMVLADSAAVLADNVFNNPAASSLDVVLGVYAFAIQIYCDFSAYSDIARGTSRMLGFELCLNFRLPYLAVNPSDFWQRWHISLSAWLRDYLYIPLGGNRRGAARTYFNLTATMVLGGLWHGASWHFVVWGAYHGLLLIVFRLVEERSGRSARPKGPRRDARFWLSVIGFFQLTALGWLIFRVDTLSQLGRMLAALASAPRFIVTSKLDLLQVLAVGGLLGAFQVLQYLKDDLEPWRRWSMPARVAFYLALFYGIVFLGATQSHVFIYFQF